MMVQSTYIYNEMPNGLGNIDADQLKRNARRNYLQKKGFVWRKAPGNPEGWNIGHYGNVALGNMIQADNQYGSIVAEMHNLKKFNRISAQEYQTVKGLIEEEQRRRRELSPFGGRESTFTDEAFDGLSKSGFIHHGTSATGLLDYPFPDPPDIIKQIDLGDYKRELRKALKSVGFNWIYTKGRRDEDFDNIDGFDSLSLENIVKAYKKHGWIVADLHNRKKFNQNNTVSYFQIEKIISDHAHEYQDDRGTTQDPAGNGGNGGGAIDPVTGEPSGNGGSGSGYVDDRVDEIITWINSQTQQGNGSQQGGTGQQGIPQNWILGGTLAAGGLVLLLLIR